MNNKDLQLNLLKTELELTQRQIDKYDQLSATTKTWTVTLWAASLGWTFQTGRKEIVYLSIFIAAVFWVLDAINKNFRRDYKERRDKVSRLLQNLFLGTPLPAGALAPDLPAHEWKGVVRELFQPHIFLLYAALVAVAVARLVIY